MQKSIKNYFSHIISSAATEDLFLENNKEGRHGLRNVVRQQDGSNRKLFPIHNSEILILKEKKKHKTTYSKNSLLTK